MLTALSVEPMAKDCLSHGLWRKNWPDSARLAASEGLKEQPRSDGDAAEVQWQSLCLVLRQGGLC